MEFYIQILRTSFLTELKRLFRCCLTWNLISACILIEQDFEPQAPEYSPPNQLKRAGGRGVAAGLSASVCQRVFERVREHHRERKRERKTGTKRERSKSGPVDRVR